LRFGGLALALSLLAAEAARADSITWVTSAQPVSHLNETQDSAQLSFLTAHLPAFTHHIVKVSPARAYHELEHGSGVCKVGVLLTPERQHYAAFSERHMLLPGYHLMVRKDRAAALAPAIVKGEIDLDRLGGLTGLAGGYTHQRHYDAPITDFTRAHDGSGVSSVVATGLLFNLMQAERLDYAFVLPMDVFFYTDEAARRKLTLLRVKGAPPSVDAGVACSSDPSGQKAILAIDTLLANDARWAEFVEPLRKWIPPEDFPVLLAGHSSDMDRVP